jgi:alkylation response protein AidB-like acyl-CoA dehydrogenase
LDFNLSDTQRMLLDSAGRYVEGRYTLAHRRALRDTVDGVDQAAWAQFAELGWLALAIPEARGGLGGSLEDVAVLMTALGARLVTDPYVSSAVLAAHILSGVDGNDDLLAEIAAGTTRVSLAHDEPEERYSERYPPIRARETVLRRSGNGLVLSGQKMMVLDGPSSDRLILTARAAGEDGLVLALVDRTLPGVSTSAYRLVDGSRAADIRFDDVALESGAILARGNRAEILLEEAVGRAEVALMAQAVGSMESCLSLCSAYLKERHQFDQPIGKFQALQHIMADMFVATHQSRSSLYYALAETHAEPAQRRRAISLARITVGEASQLVSRQAIQLHGGYGITDEYEVSHHYRRLLVIEKLYGDIDTHIRRLAPSAIA